MKLVTFGPVGNEAPGVLVDDDTIAPLDPVLEAEGLPTATLGPVIEHLERLRPAIDALIDNPAHTIPLARTRLGAPVPSPATVFAAGANYASHLRELAAAGHAFGEAPGKPVLFAKPPRAVCGPTDAIVRPAETRMLDYEGELAVVIGRRGRRIAREHASDHIAGYTVANDVTARDVVIGDSARHPMLAQLLRGKGYDTFCPLGPWLVTADEIRDPAALRITVRVNGEQRQDAWTSDMVHDVPSLVASVSECFTLCPGDVILTGSPPGVGFAMKPPRALRDGDVVEVSVTGLGTLRNPVRDETPALLSWTA